MKIEYRIVEGNCEHGFSRFWVQKRKPAGKWRTAADFQFRGPAMDWIERDKKGNVVVFEESFEGGTLAPDPGPFVLDYRWVAVAIVVASIFYKFVIKGL